ncbi:MAG: hypothetical protein LUP91_15195, partial [Methylococcaceae bacterium]|nr:hypothetical protein [Methylococcaceae bacterium]
MMYMADMDIECGAQTFQQRAPYLVLLMLELVGDKPLAVRIFQYPDIIESCQQVLTHPPAARRHQMADMVFRATLAP